MKAMSWIDSFTLICTVGCGLMAGFFFAFSVCVMQALGKLSPAQGAAAMRAINVVVINPWFLTVFMGTAAMCVLAAIAVVLAGNDAGNDLRTAYLIAGSVLYVTGTFMVTMRYNVPLNNALAAVAPDTSEATELWTRYLSQWTYWNHARTAAALAGFIAFSLALRSPSV